MGITLQTYRERLPIISGNDIIALDAASKVSMHTDSETILNSYILENAILQVAPSTTIKNTAFGASVENVLQADILDNGNIENIHTKINAIWKRQGKRHHDNKTQLDRYVRQHMLGQPITLTAGSYLLSFQSEDKSSPTIMLNKPPNNV